MLLQIGFVVVSFNNLITHHYATKMVWAYKKICENVEAGIAMTKRDLHYENNELFPKQDDSDQILTDLCCMLRCRMPALKVLLVKIGSVLGNITLKLRSRIEFELL